MKNFVRGLILLIVLISVFFVCEKTLMLKSEDGIEQMQSYYLQKENTVDVLFLGSSHIYCDINTGILWDEYGMASYDLGGAEQPYWNSYYFLKEALKTQRPKVVVLDITIPGIRSVQFQPENWVVTNLYGMKWNKNRIDATKASTLEQSYQRLLFPMYTIHGRYNDLKKNDFIDINRDISYKGFDFRDNTRAFERPEVENVTDLTPMTEKEEKYFRLILELAKEENIPLLLISVPFAVNEDAQKIYNYTFEIGREEGIEGIDFNKLYDEIGMDFENDMADEFHLNIPGSKKFTTYLGKILKEKYSVPDHRGDEEYFSWNLDALNQRQEVASYYLNHPESLESYIEQLKNDEYVTFINVGSEIDDEDLLIFAEEFNNKGLDIIKTNSGIIINNEKILFESIEDSFSAFIDEGRNKLLFERKKIDEDIENYMFFNEDVYEIDEETIAFLVYDRQLEKCVSFYEIEP